MSAIAEGLLPDKSYLTDTRTAYKTQLPASISKPHSGIASSLDATLLCTVISVSSGSLDQLRWCMFRMDLTDLLFWSRRSACDDARDQ